MFVSCLAFLDDCYLVASTIEQCQAMLNDVILEFGKVGLELNPSKCAWIADKHCYPFDGGYHGRSIAIGEYLVAQVGRLVVLGSVVCCDSSEQHPILHRVSCAWKCFHKWGHVFKSSASIQAKAAFWCKTVLRSLIWGTVTLRGDNFVLQKLDCVQNDMFRKMLGLKRRPLQGGGVEPWLEWQKRTLAKAKDTINSLGCRASNHFKNEKLRWAQHCMRFGLNNKPSHLLKPLLLYRCNRWWSLQQMYNNFNWDPVFHATRGRPYL